MSDICARLVGADPNAEPVGAGEARQTPTFETTLQVNGVGLRIAVPYVLLNGNDPDVSFAFTFCSSIGSVAEAEAAVRRGLEKARFGPPTVAASGGVAMLADALTPYASALKQLATAAGTSSLPCRFTSRGPLVAVTKRDGNRTMQFELEGPKVRAYYADGGFAVTETLKPTQSPDRWVKSAKTRVAKAAKLERAIAKLGVSLPGDYD